MVIWYKLKDNEMSKKQKLIDYLMKLQNARQEAFDAAQWERVDFIGQCISDTQDKIAKLEK